jgi:hypothetical protein
VSVNYHYLIKVNSKREISKILEMICLISKR